MAKKMPHNQEDQNDVVGDDVVGEMSKVHDQNIQRISLMEAQYGAEQPYSLLRSIEVIRFNTRVSATAYLASGMELLRIKEHEPHGDFLQIIEEELHMNQRTARRMMSVAYKYQGKLKVFTEKLNPTKLLELASEDDGDLEGLLDGGTVAGKSLDEIDRMSAGELRAALRKEKDKRAKESEVHEKLITQKDQKINELDKRLHTTPDYPEVISELRINTTTATGSALMQVDALAALSEAIQSVPVTRDDESEERLSAAMAEHYLTSVEQLYSAVTELTMNAREMFEGYLIHSSEIADNAPETRD